VDNFKLKIDDEVVLLYIATAAIGQLNPALLFKRIKISFNFVISNAVFCDMGFVNRIQLGPSGKHG
jgi:hypothetical protein